MLNLLHFLIYIFCLIYKYMERVGRKCNISLEKKTKRGGEKKNKILIVKYYPAIIIKLFLHQVPEYDEKLKTRQAI